MLQAELRASVFLALETSKGAQDNNKLKNTRVQQFTKSSQGKVWAY